MGRPGKKAKRLGLDTTFEDDLFEEQADDAENLAKVLDSLPEGFDPLRPESSYRELVSETHRKRFAQFFTPEPIAQLMVDWVFEGSPKTVLDPSVGPGVFLRVAQKENFNAQLTGVDIDPVAISAAQASLQSENLELHRGDFLTWPDQRRFDGIVSNPPYLRHHDMHYGHDIFQEIGRRNEVSLSKLANMYVLFVLEICRRLTARGRAAIIVPGEWTNANFGMPLKQYLFQNGYFHSLIYYSNMSEQFEDALTTAAILLIERSPTPHLSLSTYFVEHTAPLNSLRDAVWNARSEPGVKHRRFQNNELIDLEKWDKALRDGLAELRAGFVPLGNFAKSRRGIATGANEFFFSSLEDVKRNGIRLENTKPCVGRSEQVPGLLFSSNDFQVLEDRSARTRLLDLPKVLSETEAAYVETGAKEGLQERFLLASRKPWYSMEKRAPAQIWAAVFGRTNLRFIFNEAGVSNLTTFHCIYPVRTDAAFCKALVACLNSRIVQEMAEHQRRVYGGGLLKFEPRDLLSIQVPDLTFASTESVENLAAIFVRLDVHLREDSTLPLEFLDELDQLVLEAAATVTAPTLF